MYLLRPPDSWSDVLHRRAMKRELLLVLQKCNSVNQLRQTHLQIVVHGLSRSNYLVSKLISLCRSTTYALQLFQTCPSPDVTTHNFLIKLANERNSPSDAFFSYNRLWVSGIRPNSYTFTFVLKSCELLEEMVRGELIHGKIIRCGFESHVFVMNPMLDFYAKVGNLGLAKKVFENMGERDVCSWNSMINACIARGEMCLGLNMFDQMPERNIVSWNLVIRGHAKAGDMDSARVVFDRITVTKNELSWNTMITGYVSLGDMSSARDIFEKMIDKTVVSWTAMITGYANVGDMDSMRNLFDMMPVKNVASWNAMISGFNNNSQFSLSLQTFHQMLIDGRCLPDETTMTSTVSACAQLGALEHGNWIHSYVQKNKFQVGVNLGNALIDMFAKCGDVKTAESIFRRMPRRCIITWTSMIAGLGLNGKCREALSVFKEMFNQGVKPDDTVFIAVLTACAHGGLVKEGCELFDQMPDKFGIVPRVKHYGCIVDLLGRAGKLQEAIQFIEGMPVEPKSVTWAALLSSCKAYGNGEFVDYVSRKIALLDPFNSGYHVLVSNSNASVGKWQEVSDVRSGMRCVGLEKVPGCSSIQVGSEVHEFLVKDARHRMRKEIYDILDGLTALLRKDECEKCTT